MQGAGMSPNVSRPTVGGVLSQLYDFSSKLWSRVMINTARVFGIYPDLAEGKNHLDRARMRLVRSSDEVGAFDSVLAVSTQVKLARLELVLAQLQEIQSLVEEVLSEPLSEPKPNDMSHEEAFLREHIRRELWDLDALRSAIVTADEDLGLYIQRFIGGPSVSLVPDHEEVALKKTRFVLRSLRTKIQTLQAEILRLETLNPVAAGERLPRERRVRFQEEPRIPRHQRSSSW